MSKKKIMIIVVTVIAVLAIIGGGITWWLINSGNEIVGGQEQQEGETSKLSRLYSELKEKQAYQVTLKLDDQNEIFYAKKENKAYVDTKYEGQNSKFIIKDGNSYLLLDDRKTYYTYQNNETELGKIEAPFETAKNSQYVEGKEKIEGKEYRYEEYEKIDDFLMESTEKEETAKTRFYFNGDKLVYIKTIVGNYEETLKVDLTYTVDEKLFEIPSDYQEA